MLLSSHMDTAEAGEAAAWQDSPFTGEVRDDVLHGLGASDCKAGLAAQIYAGALLKRSPAAPARQPGRGGHRVRGTGWQSGTATPDAGHAALAGDSA